MASTRIREARESDCGDIMRMIRVKTAVWKNSAGWGWGAGSSLAGVGESEMRVHLWTLFSEIRTFLP
jgi:hypothetical protein